MNSLAELQRRKAKLAAQIEQQRADLKQTFLEVRKEMHPAALLRKAISEFFNASDNKATEMKTGTFGQLPGVAYSLAELLIKDPKWVLVAKMLAPVALHFFQKPEKRKEQALDLHPQKPAKAKIYGGLRRGVAALRGQLRKIKQEDEGANSGPIL